MKKISSAFKYRIIFFALIIAMLIVNGIALPALLDNQDTTQPTDIPTSLTVEVTDTQPPVPQTETTKSTTAGTTVPSTTATPATEPATEAVTHAVEAPPFNRSVELQKLITPLAATPVGYSYFDNAVFLGDSVTLGFQMHINNLKKAKTYAFPSTNFICGKSYGVYNALREISENTVHPLYEGDQRYPWDIIKIYSPEKVFISFGLNDIGMLTKTRYINDYLTIIGKIRDQLPDVQIIILSVTPLTEDGQLKVLNNERINDYNNALIMMAHENNCSFVDIAEVLRDINGHLPSKLSSDNYCHLTFEAYERIIKYHMSHPAVTGRYPDIVLPGPDKPVISSTTAAPGPPATTKAPITTKAPETTKAPVTTKAQETTKSPTISPPVTTSPPATTAPQVTTSPQPTQTATRATEAPAPPPTLATTQSPTDIPTDTTPTEPTVD